MTALPLKFSVGIGGADKRTDAPGKINPCREKDRAGIETEDARQSCRCDELVLAGI
jgi:hypothetical protein